MPVLESTPVIRRIDGFRQYVLTVPTLLMAISLLGSGCAQPAKPPPIAQPVEARLSPDQQRLNVESFDLMWDRIHERYWDVEFGGLDWAAVKAELRPKVEQVETMSQARAIMSDLVHRLGESHLNLIPKEVYEAVGRPEGQGELDGDAGIDVRVEGGQALVVSVEEGTPADEAGVRPGWIIERIGEKDVAEGLAVLEAEFKDKTLKDLVLAESVLGRLEGAVGEPVRVTFRDGEGRERVCRIGRVRKRGWETRLGHMPAMYVRFDSRRLDGNIGYVSLSNFMNPVQVMPAYNEAMGAFLDADGVIVDLRGNGGGLGAMVMGMCGWFIPDREQYLGTMTMRHMTLKLVIAPRVQTFEGPVVVLVDGLSASASEFMAGGLQALGRACVIGSRTAGAALPSQFERLPNGDGFQYVFGNYVAAGGERLEGIGVKPDVEVRPDRKALLEGRDCVLDAAIAWIRQKRPAGGRSTQAPEGLGHTDALVVEE